MALSGIGDALMFTPALKKLKELMPDSEIDALVMYRGAEDIYKRLPYFSKVYRFD
ncbi:MAG: glycosyltransferase family 9 protein, partial [Melioribacteraceae bacterium]